VAYLPRIELEDERLRESHGVTTLDFEEPRQFSHSTKLCGGAPTPFVISLQLFSLTPHLGSSVATTI
jgi:hypothetical protein